MRLSINVYEETAIVARKCRYEPLQNSGIVMDKRQVCDFHFQFSPSAVKHLHLIHADWLNCDEQGAPDKRPQPPVSLITGRILERTGSSVLDEPSPRVGLMYEPLLQTILGMRRHSLRSQAAPDR